MKEKLILFEKELVRVKNDVNWSYTSVSTWTKKIHYLEAKIELLNELLLIK
jgi:hypothetical protein